MNRKAIITSAVLLFALADSGQAYIHRMYSLQEILGESTHVLVGKITKVDRQNRIAVAEIQRALKGRLELREIKMNIGLGPRDQAQYLLSLLESGAPFIIFYKHEGWRLASVAHSGDTWFQLYGEGHQRDVWWRMSHLEIYMGRTFNGSSDELIRVTEGVLKRRIKSPRPDPTVPRLDIRRAPRRRTGAAGQLKVLLAKNSIWKYLKGIRGVSSDWYQSSFNDSSWASGRAPFGYGDPPFGTQLKDMQQAAGRRGYSTLFLRKKFQLDDPAAVKGLELVIDYDDGFIVWINGKEATSTNKPPGRISHTSLSSGQHESGSYESFFIENPRRYLIQGSNQVAVQVFNCSLDSSDLKMNMELKATLIPVKKSPGGFRLLTKFNCLGGQIRGISCSDVNGDERMDLYFCRSHSNLLLVNEGGKYADLTGRFRVAAGSSSASWADYNLDDHSDLLVDNFRLFTNQGARFQDTSKLLVAKRPPGARATTGWIDFNGDGLPDILVASQQGLRIFANTGKGPGWFREATDRAGLGKGAGKGMPGAITIADYDGDGYTDFFYHQGTGLLAHNEGNGTFRFNTKSGIRLAAANYPGGTAFGDFDNDGDLDLFMSSPGRPRLYRNKNDGTFEDIAGRSGDLAKSTAASFAGAWGDVDGDGFLDLFVCHSKGQSRLYLGNGKGSFQDATGKLRLPQLSPAYAATFADVDGDGDLDLAVNLESDVQIFRNENPCPPGRGWLRVMVLARKGRIGTAVRILDAKGRFLGMRELGGQSSTIAHLGIPRGTSMITAMLSDGRVAQKKVTIKSGKTEVFLQEDDFK